MAVRDATAEDAAACAAIYAPYVLETAVSFETEPPTAEQMRERIEGALATHAWLVLEEDGAVRGYAYAGAWRGRAAYQWNAEVSVYLDPELHRSGAGTALYTALFDRLRRRGYRVALAGMTLPNEASQGLHASLGFEPVGTFRGVGWKLGGWHDVHWMQRPLSEPGDPCGPPG
jgi:phosphinothricin acetyltransferase